MPRFLTSAEPERTASRLVLISPNTWDVLESYDKNLKSKLIRAIRWISRDIGHPSLRLELIKSGKDSFYCVRVDPNFRIHFRLEESDYRILLIDAHHLGGVG